MADLEKTIEIIFNASDRTGGAFSSVGAGLSDLASKGQAVTGPLASVAESILAAEAAALTAGIAVSALAINEFGKLESAANEVGTLFGGTGEQINQFRDDVIAYAQGSTQSLESINGAVYAAVSAGIDYTQAIGALGTAEQLAVASKATLNESLLVLVSSLNAYGLGTEKATEYADALFNTVRQGQTTLPELAASLAQVTGIAANSGVSFDTLLASVAALTASGLGTSEAITGIKAALSNIIAPSTAAADESARLGIAFNATALRAKDFDGVLAEIKEKTGGNIDSMRAMFGSVEALNTVLTLPAPARKSSPTHWRRWSRRAEKLPPLLRSCRTISNSSTRICRTMFR